MAKSTDKHLRMTLDLDETWFARVERLRGVMRSKGTEINLSLICREAVKAAVTRLEKEHGVRGS